jgi:hypothetical protein
MSMRPWFTGVALLAAASAPATPKVGWVRASGQLDAETPSRYTPLNLLDGLSSTAWCTRGADALSESVTFGFAEPVKLTRLDVSTGNGTSSEAFHAFSRVRKLLLRGADATATVLLEDKPGPQSVQLEKPLAGRTFLVEVLDTFAAEDPLAPVCMSDLLPFAGVTPLAGAALRKSLGYQPQRAELLGLWYGGPEAAPDRTLAFFLDGTWRYGPEGTSSHVKPLSGKWWVTAGQAWLTLPGHGKVSLQPQVGRRSGEGKPVTTLSFAGAVGELKQSFRDRR